MDMQLTNESGPTIDRVKEFSVVGIAVSPSKLGALKQFLDHLDIENGLSYVIAQIGPAKSRTIQIKQLSKHTEKKIFFAENNMELLPDCIYLIPPQHDIDFRAGIILLTKCSADSHPANMPADRFMKALVKGYGSNTIGILFAGNGIDGTIGINAIAQGNGLIMVEEKNSNNPVHLTGSDIEIDRTDYILSPQDMPQHIIEYIEFYINQTKESIDVEMKTLFSIIKQQSGTDFSEYKQASVMRRIQRRMAIQQFQYLKEYNKYLYQHEDEVIALQKDLLIGVTEFFRDPVAFAILETNVIPAIFERQQQDKQIRVWVPGCSTGEEVYSIAILMKKYMVQTEQNFEIKIFATDLDKDAIQTASKGIYSDDISKNVEPDILKTYFTLYDNKYKVNKDIRQMIIFAQHNLLTDPPFIQLDLVSCRNMLIYFQPDAQRKVISTFNFSLKTEAFLFLGPSESLGKLTNLFFPLNNKWNIYQQKETKHLFVGSSLDLDNRENGKKLFHKNKIINRLKETEKIFKLDTIYTKLIEDYVATCIIVDKNNDIVHINGDVNAYLSIPMGKASLNLLKMVPEYLSIIIGAALHKARKEKKDVIYRNVAIKDTHKAHTIQLTVKSFTVNSTNEKLMILFIEDVTKRANGESNEEDKIELSFKTKGNMDKSIEDLDQELLIAKESLLALKQKLETSNEELETSIEELESTNDQLIVSNEELQSTNEELQSGNEELIAVNNEYQYKIQELTEINTDMSNFFNSTNIATIFLDKKLVIRKFTPAAAKEINLQKKQIGLPIGDLRHNFKYEHLATDARKVLLTGESIENEVQSLTGEWFIIKILPYLSNDFNDLKEGVVITCINITEQRLSRITEETGKINGNLELMHISEMLAVRGQLAAGISQEIQNPLLALKEFAKSNESMTSELNRIEVMINELLILAPPLKSKYANIDLVAILQDIVAKLEPQAVLNKVELLVKFSVPVLYFNCVQVQIKQLFINILSNGIAAMPQGGNLIVKVKVASDKTAVISFSDSGIESDVESSMELDMRVNNKIIENHQGAISIDKTSGGGKVVEIVLNI
jgi:two-component system CheB/CheR fusion protein